MTQPRLLLSWSSGKDSAWTLYRLQREGRYEVAGLVTTVNEAFERVAMHAVRVELLDPRQLAPSFAGRPFDAGLPAALPPGADPCGENGEFHTFCHAGPVFREPIPVHAGAIVERDGFVYADVLPASHEAPLSSRAGMKWVQS